MGDAGANSASPFFFFFPFFPDGRGFGSALMGQYADVAQSAEHRAGRYVVGSSPTVCTRSSAHAKYKLNGLPGIEHKKKAETCTYRG